MYHKSIFIYTMYKISVKGVDDWEAILFEKCETHKQHKERETFWQHRLKIFYPLGPSEKKRIFYILI